MFDNYFRVSFQKLDAQSCLTLADYLEGQAAMLRRRANDEEAQENGRRDRLKNLHLAGLDALDFFRRGLNKTAACHKSATQNDVPFINVEAVFKNMLDSEIAEKQRQTRERIFKMRRAGATVRFIAQAVELSPSRISQILKS